VTDARALLEVLRQEIRDERVLAALAAVPREAFVPPGREAEAWANQPLEIGCGQTISQPLVVARMAELLDVRPGDRVLDVGTGSGYHAAILATLGGRVVSVERHAELSAAAAAALTAAGVRGVELVVGDGSDGLPAHGPYDAVNVAAATPEDDLAPLEAQLASGGRLVAPVVGRRRRRQRLVLSERRPEGVVRTPLEEVRFVPLVRD
jgi:protein-L-isoaspartate(D-aspartate) O-methyltransferase